MSVYSTKDLTREEAIEMVIKRLKYPHNMTNDELEEELFKLYGDECLPDSTFENYRIK